MNLSQDNREKHFFILAAVTAAVLFLNIVVVSNMNDLAAIIGTDIGTTLENINSSININPENLQLEKQLEIKTGTGTLQLEKSIEGTQIEKSVKLNLPSGSTLDINKTTGTTGTTGSVKMLGPAGQSLDVELKSGEGGLDLLIQRGNLTPADKSVLINLPGGSEILINKESDLNTYKKIVIEQRPSINNIEVAKDSVSVSYKQPGRFLGIFKTYLNSEVNVTSGGKVQVKLPWYSFLFSNNTGAIKKQLSVNLGSASSSGEIQVNALGSADESVRVKQAARVVNVVSSTIEGNVSIASPTNVVCPVPSDFPFSRYPALRDLDSGGTYGTVIAGAIDSDKNSRITLIIARGLQVQKGSNVGTAYVFDSLELDAGGHIDNLYIYTGAATAFEGGTAGKIVRLNKSDLIRKAMVAVGLLGSECNY